MKQFLLLQRFRSNDGYGKRCPVSVEMLRHYVSVQKVLIEFSLGRENLPLKTDDSQIRFSGKITGSSFIQIFQIAVVLNELNCLGRMTVPQVPLELFTTRTR